MATNGKATFEINGTTFEVRTDERIAAPALAVGDRVKLLKKEYGDTYKSSPGIIVAVDLFKALPTVVVMYCEYGYSGAPELKFAYLNAKSTDVELARMSPEEDFVSSRDDALAQFARAEQDLQQKLDTLRERREFFLRRFGVAFGVAAKDLTVGAPLELEASGAGTF